MVFSSSTVARAVLTGLAAALVFPVVAAAGSFGRRAWWVVLGSFLGIAALVATGALYRQGRRERADESESVWEMIPGWQYEGRHVESGGLTRDEQEQALREIQERAESEGRCSE
ncbi:Protein of unknown function [Halogranum amylolyticum]|uniref:Uncharacterized protein n=1 Tax=Halogranum amylolyticum TaxID=660520 RepID=A0A1H8TAT0_9EURY|nr:DUF2029 domain-containing protein [Halogranum amylolyticum]SEO88200.1 Protein of unknown function [Halogranum amylolyticum]